MIPLNGPASFPCKEPGCGQIVSVGKAGVIPIQTGCTSEASASSAFRCYSCGRLHWRSGAPVLNRRYEKAYFKSGTITHSRLSTVEKKDLIRQLIAICEEDTSDDSSVASLLLFTTSGHSPDCPAVAGKDASCTCGMSDAQTFINSLLD